MNTKHPVWYLLCACDGLGFKKNIMKDWSHPLKDLCAETYFL